MKTAPAEMAKRVFGRSSMSVVALPPAVLKKTK